MCHKKSGMGSFINKVFMVISKLASFNLTDKEKSLFCAILFLAPSKFVLFSATTAQHNTRLLTGRDGLKNCLFVQNLLDQVFDLLSSSLQNRPNNLFARLMYNLYELKAVAEEYSRIMKMAEDKWCLNNLCQGWSCKRMSFYFRTFIKKRVFTGWKPHYKYVFSLKLES